MQLYQLGAVMNNLTHWTLGLNLDRVLGVLAVILATLALIPAVKTIFDSKKILVRQEKAAATVERQVKSLNEISDSSNRIKGLLDTLEKRISTRYISSFPGYLKDITQLINRSDSSLLIVSLLPNVGIFSSPQEWLHMRSAISTALQRNIAVQCHFGSSAERQLYLTRQFELYKNDWTSWVNSAENRKRFSIINDNYDLGIDGHLTSFDDFIEMFETTATYDLDHSYRGAQIDISRLFFPLQVYIADDREAIFAVATTTPELDSEAFWTCDPSLIGAIKKMYAFMFRD